LFDEVVAARGRDEEKVPFIGLLIAPAWLRRRLLGRGFAIPISATTVADGDVTGDSLLPSSVVESIFVAGLHAGD
jgi:hypothetical protein